MGFLKELWGNYKYYKHVRATFPNTYKAHYYFPSETIFKYPSKSDFGGVKTLNLGCGKSVYKAPNVVNLDCIANEGVNIVWDLSKTPLPFESDSFDLIIANHVIEHIPNWFECMKELARIVKPGGKIEVWIPPVSGDSAFTYRDHINYIGDESWSGCETFSRSGTNLAAESMLKSVGEFSKLSVVTRNIRMSLQWWIIFAPPSIRQFFVDHLRNVVSEVGYTFIKRETI